MSVETNPHNYTNMNNTFSQFFKFTPNPPRTKRGANGKFLPKPLFFHLRHPNSKTNESKFWQILPQKIVFAKLRPHCSATCPRPWGQNTKEKCPFLFQEKFHHHHIREARNIFLWCCRVKRGSGRTIHSTSGFCWKKVRILFKRHSKKVEFVFSPKCGASQSDATGVSARIRQGFLKSKRSERDARRGFMMSTSFKTSFCEPIWKRIIINI